MKYPGIFPMRIRWHLISGFLICAVPYAHADSTNNVLLPGPVAMVHSKYEDSCEICHKRFEKEAQPDLCKRCHKEVAKDVIDNHGLHGHHAENQPCKECHHEHKGRDVRLFQIDPKNFDHAKQTGFALKGGHLSRKVHCKNCHSQPKKFREVLKTCNGCHAKRDKHKGALGTGCQNCHEERKWKATHFDHGKTKFPVLGKHIKVKCKACHVNDKFKQTPKLCGECHKKNDKHKGNFGKKCETCHTDRGWKEILFDHDKSTKYPLLGKHHEAKCIGCHKGKLQAQKLKTDCYSCHKKDDKHKGEEGIKCESCHNPRSWKKADYDHRQSSFALTGMHVLVPCNKCHITAALKETRSECSACHPKQDVHMRRLGNDCQTCHNTRDWRDWDFNHDKTTYKLLGKHSALQCIDCHRTSTSQKRALGASCLTCHGKEDKHGGAFGERCVQCHAGLSWKDIKVGGVDVMKQGEKKVPSAQTIPDKKKHGKKKKRGRPGN